MSGSCLHGLRAATAFFYIAGLVSSATVSAQGPPQGPGQSPCEKSVSHESREITGRGAVGQSVAELMSSLAASHSECLLILRSSPRRPREVLLYVCGDDHIDFPDVRSLVSSFRSCVAPSESLAIDVLHNHPEALLVRAHSSTAASYRGLRREIGLRTLSASVVRRQLRVMRSGSLPGALLPPSTTDLVTALKILWLSEADGIDVSFHVYNVAGSWRIARRGRGWESRKFMIRSLLLDDHLFGVLNGTARPRSDFESRCSAWFHEYWLLRNRIAQVYSQEAFDRYESGDLGGVVEEELEKRAWLRRLREVSQKLGLLLEFESTVAGNPWPTLPMPQPAPEILALDGID